MSAQAELRCRCGEVRGSVANPARRTVNRIVCYCDDCQAFAHHLGRADLLDAHGGSDIVQVAPAALTFSQGQQHIAGVRLTPKGMLRWYARCCNTPVGNTLSPRIPFVGILAQAFDRPDTLFDKPVGAIFGKYAVGDAPAGATRVNLWLVLRAARLLVRWRLRGQSWPHPFFARQTGKPVYPLSVLSAAQREALRPLCGPNPTAYAAGQPAQ